MKAKWMFDLPTPHSPASSVASGGLARSTNAETSQQAASASDRMPQRLKFLALIVAAEDVGLTSDECETALGLPHGPRCAELARAGLIFDSGRTRPTRYGSQSIVWIATEAGRRAIHDSRDA